MHRVKGLEFDYVVVVDVNDGVCPPKPALQSAGTDPAALNRSTKEESLIYVAMTRAKGVLLTGVSAQELDERNSEMETASNASMFLYEKGLPEKESVGRKKGKKGLYLEADGWNDYGYETLFELYWIDEDNKSHDIGPVKIAHKSKKLQRDLLRNSFGHLEENFLLLRY